MCIRDSHKAIMARPHDQEVGLVGDGRGEAAIGAKQNGQNKRLRRRVDQLRGLYRNGGEQDRRGAVGKNIGQDGDQQEQGGISTADP